MTIQVADSDFIFKFGDNMIDLRAALKILLEIYSPIYKYLRYVESCDVKDVSTGNTIPLVKDTCFAEAIGASNGLAGSTNMMEKVIKFKIAEF